MVKSQKTSPTCLRAISAFPLDLLSCLGVFVDPQKQRPVSFLLGHFSLTPGPFSLVRRQPRGIIVVGLAPSSRTRESEDKDGLLVPLTGVASRGTPKVCCKRQVKSVIGKERSREAESR